MKNKVHTQYKLKDGTRVPSVTTVLGLLSKNALIEWAYQCGLRGEDYKSVRDEKGLIGALTHAMILSFLKGEECDTSSYSKDQIDQAENSFLSYLEWAKDKEIKPIVIETPLVSEEYQFGGTPDFYGIVDDKLLLMDYKTGFVGQEAFIQTCTYRELLIENGYDPAEKILILGIPRTSDEKFQEVTYTSFDTGWEVFRHLREVYELMKQIK